jgi:mono/diheme cytochrome c family protein
MEKTLMTKQIHDENLLADHEYDGIQELDNKLPPWWLYLFYITIIWGIAYMLYYHVFGIGDLSYAEYMKEIDPEWTEIRKAVPLQIGYNSPYYSGEVDLTPLQRQQLESQRAIEAQILAAEKSTDEQIPISALSFDELIVSALQVASPENQEKLRQAFPEIYQNYLATTNGSDVEESLEETKDENKYDIPILTDDASLAAGKNLFEINCATCHGKLGEGGIGPNLADEYFLHGAGMASIVRILNIGVAAKGMIAWRGILKEDQIQQVASYVMALQGTDPPNAKEPQGEKVSIADSN